MLFWSWDNSKKDLGLLDFRYCPHCGTYELHTMIKHHKHFLLNVIPFYISNKFYGYCTECGYVTRVDKKYAKNMHKMHSSIFHTQQQLTTFFEEIVSYINNEEVIEPNGINQEKMINLKNKVYSKYCNVYPYQKQFYDECIEHFANSIFKEVSNTIAK